MSSRSPFLLLLALLAASAGACGKPSVPATTACVAAARPAQASAPPPSLRDQLALVRPPPPPCRARSAAPDALAAQAAAELDAGEHERALACAEEALRASPRLVPALVYRADALAAAGRLEEARLAYARALAVAPDDLEALYGAADLYVSREGGDRAALELGLEYALQGVQLARRARRPDARAGALLLLAATAENELGESGQALAHADQALAAGADEADARYERGVALYELCRFEEARASFRRVLALAPEDPWALHQLALVAERTGDGRSADALERRARAVAPDEFPAPIPIALDEFEREVRRAVDALPEADRRALANVPIEVAEVPKLEDLSAVDPPLSPSILGLFRGPSDTESCLPDDGPRCRSIVFYRRNLARFARSRTELEQQVRVTLMHELGHLRGESDDELRARGLE